MKLVKIKVRDTYGEDIIVPTTGSSLFLSKCNIKALESKQPISWHYHNVYKKIKYVYWDSESDSETPKFYLEENKLYNYRKLNKLYKSDNFKQQKYSFFFYGEVERLLKHPVTNKGMSGLF